ISPRVPSRGSTRTKLSGTHAGHARLAASSDTTEVPGSTRASPSRITASAASSAAVTGERSALVRASRARGPAARMAAAAADAMVVSSSRSRRSATKKSSAGTRGYSVLFDHQPSRLAGRAAAVYHTVSADALLSEELQRDQQLGNGPRRT